ncbi:MAG: zinc-binding dehydrogenase [Thermoplasmatota archaeon]
MTSTMRAALIRSHGGLDKIEIANVPKPEPGPGEALVAIRAASANHLDVHTRRGLPGFTLAMPHVLGCDGAGVVESVGPGAETQLVGKRVVINPMLWDGTCEFCKAHEESLCFRLRLLGEHLPGTFCEYRAVPVRNLILLPSEVPFETAAAACLVYQTAWRMAQRARMHQGEDVLIFGASGGVGMACVDIAHHLGCRVFAVSRGPEKVAQLRKLGVAHAFDGAAGGLREAIREITAKRGVDVVMDQVGADTYTDAIRSLRRGGRYVTCGATTGNAPPAELHYIFWNQLDVLGSTMANLTQTKEVMNLVFEGKLRPVIDRVLPLEKVADAQRALEERTHFGKIVIRP